MSTEMKLIVATRPVEASISVWDSAWMIPGGVGFAVLIGLIVVTVRRTMGRGRDPYEKLFRRLCVSGGVDARTARRVMMNAGGEPRRAVGILLERVSGGRG